MSSATWLLFSGVPAGCVVLSVRCPAPRFSCSSVPALGVLWCVCGVLGDLAPVHGCACSLCCIACAVSWATWLPFIGVPAGCVVLRVRCPGPLGSPSPVRALGVLWCVCGVLSHLAPVHRCAGSVRCMASAVSWATWVLFTGMPARCVVLRVRCRGPLDSCSPVRPLGVLCCVCGVLGHLAPVHQCARWVCCVACAVSWATWLLFTGVPSSVGYVACAVSWATWLLFTGVPARWLVLCVRCPRPLDSCSPVCLCGLLCCVCRVLGHLAPVHRCARWVCCVACAVPWPPGPCSPMCSFCPLLCLYAVLGHVAPVHRCAGFVRCLTCAVSWATWLPFTGVPGRCVVLCVRCPGPLGSCSQVCSLGVSCCLCGVLGHLAPVHRCARSAPCFACAVSWATFLLFTGVPARCLVLHVPCPRPLGSCSPVCPLVGWCCVSVVLGHLAPVHRCARWMLCVASAVSWATWLLFTSVPVPSLALLVGCPGPLGFCSPVCPLCALLGVCRVLGHLAAVHWCAHAVCCVVCAVSRATSLLFTGVPARCVVLRVRRPGPLDSCSPLCPLCPLLCLCGVLGHVSPVHQCARSVLCFACALSSATFLLFTGVPARCLVLPVRCPGPLGSCSPVCALGALLGVCGVLGHLAAVHRCAHAVCCVACAVSWATWLLFTGVLARCVVLLVRRPGPLRSCSPVRPLGVLCCLCDVLGRLAPVHQCARSVSCVACAVSWATWLPFTDVPARRVVLRVHLAPVHGCARSVFCSACGVSWATWLLFAGVPAWCVAWRVQCPRPLGCRSLVCPRGV